MIFEPRPLYSREPLMKNKVIGIDEKKEMVEFVFVDKNTLTDALGEQYEKRFQMPGLNQVRRISL